VKYLDKALIAAGAALLLSGGIAAAALGPSNVANNVMASLPGDVTLAAQNNMASRRWLSTGDLHRLTSALRTELRHGKSLADVRVAHGKDRSGLIAALTAAGDDQITTLVDTKNRSRTAGRRSRLPHRGRSLDAAATYLGITAADLRTKLAAGQTLAQIAAATSARRVTD